MKPQRIAIIGGVAAGTAAAAEAKRTDPRADVVLFEKGEHISYGACEIPLFLAGEVEKAEDLVAFSPERFELERGVSVLEGTTVERIDPRSGELVYATTGSSEQTIESFDKFILATGARARIPNVEGAQAENVFAVRELSDAVALRTFLDSRSFLHAVVVGGGFVGIEVAEALVHRGMRVSMLQENPGPLHAHLEAEVSRKVSEVLEGAGVTVRNDRMSDLVLSNRGDAHAVKTAAGELIGCQLVILAMGIEPNTKLGVQAGVKIGSRGGYRVGECMRTNLSNVWACGDCVEVKRVVDGKSVLSPLSLTGFKTGRTAGRNAARRGTGRQARFEGVVGAQGLKIFDAELAYVGLTHRDAIEAGFAARSVTIEHRTKAALSPGSEAISVTLIFDTVRGRLLGGQLLGGSGSVLRADVLIPLIRSGATVAHLYEQDLIYSPPFSPRLDPLLVAAKYAMNALQDSEKT